MRITCMHVSVDASPGEKIFEAVSSICKKVRARCRVHRVAFTAIPNPVTLTLITQTSREGYTSQVFLSKMEPTVHATRQTPHGASRLVQAVPAWSVKTRRAPFRHCRGSRVCQTTTAHL